MRELSHFVGLDVHKDTISVAVAEAGRAQARDLGSIPNELAKLRRKLDRLGPRRSIYCCYEAGPTGYGLYRHLIVEGYACSVVAPSKIPLKLGDRVKTDRRDALKLAHYLRSGDLTEVWVPDPQVEALRDLVRSREAAKADQRAARHRLSKFLLRLDRRYTTGKRAWTKKHLEWVRSQRFEYPTQDCAHREMLHAVEEITDRIVRLDLDIDREALFKDTIPPAVGGHELSRTLQFFSVGLICLHRCKCLIGRPLQGARRIRSHRRPCFYADKFLSMDLIL